MHPSDVVPAARPRPRPSSRFPSRPPSPPSSPSSPSSAPASSPFSSPFSSPPASRPSSRPHGRRASPRRRWGARSPFRTASRVAAVAVPLCILLATTGVLAPYPSQVVDDLAQLAAGAFAAAACLVTWRRAAGPHPAGPWAGRTWRALLFAGTAGWTCGQAVWSWYQLVADRELPSPSWADVGYFALPVFAVPALLALPTLPAPVPAGARGPDGGDRRVRLLLVLDALVVVGSLFLLTWSTALGAVVHAGAATAAAFTVAVAYPVTDVAMVVLVLLVGVFRRPRAPRTLLLLGAGLVALSVSDSLFTYAVATGADDMPPLWDAGFVAGPVLLGLGALAPQAGQRRPRRATPSRAHHARVRAQLWSVLLPYLPLGAIGLLVVVQQLAGLAVDGTEAYGLVALVGLVVVRQLLTLLENLDLLRRLQDSEDALRHQAFHDELTGLPNRALFADRLEQAVERHGRRGHRLALLFCDLDDFKTVNDTFGHATGDELLRAVAQRLRRCVRAGDTVARLGGDEFAVVLDDDGTSPHAVAERMLAALAEPLVLDGGAVSTRASAGLVVVRPGEPAVPAGELLQRADAAMYAAKRAGGGRLAVAPAPGAHAVRA